ncbi:hypothetical protein MNBD_CHLOROFLEXI01-2256 [hydrothermal vent metagenome]|uniref:Uncharacterized protein n=1 Tax=hydrothermal vent metagenome TaxID=652676 RepID=A0A3B0V126_9ZZZZ
MSIIKAQNVNHPDHRQNLKEEKYTIIREAMLAILPNDSSDGMPFAQLEDEVKAYLIAKNVPTEMFPKLGSVRWYCKSVQLDLEAKGLIERLPKRSPIQLRKAV